MVLLIGQLQPHIKTKKIKSTIAARRCAALGLPSKLREAFASNDLLLRFIYRHHQPRE
jgi:hypothetical protein